MKEVKIYGNNGNIVYTDLDETEKKDKSKDGNIAWVYYGQTTKAEMRKHIDNRDYMICQYHTEGYNTAFVYPMSCVINFSQPGTELVEFTNEWIDGQVKHITYNMETDTWSAR